MMAASIKYYLVILNTNEKDIFFDAILPIVAVRSPLNVLGMIMHGSHGKMRLQHKLAVVLVARRMMHPPSHLLVPIPAHFDCNGPL